MNIFNLFFSWYFVYLPKRIYQIWVNFLWFFKNYFALAELSKTFIYPWKGIYFRKTSRGLDIGETVANFIFNNFSRIVGAFLRLIFILIGGVIEIFVAILGIVVFLIWIAFLPFLIFSLIKGIQLLI